MAQVAEMSVGCKTLCVQEAPRHAARETEWTLSAARRLLAEVMGEIESELDRLAP